MAKLIAVMNVVAWSGFWAFGYLALTSASDADGSLMVAMFLAVAGGGTGMWTWLWLVRHSERTGYAKPANRVQKEDEEIG